MVCEFELLGHSKPKKIGAERSESLTDYSVFSPEITMPKINLTGMSVEALMDLRKRVEETLK